MDSFNILPDDIIIDIVLMLSLVDFGNLSITCKHTNKTLSNYGKLLGRINNYCTKYFNMFKNDVNLNLSDYDKFKLVYTVYKYNVREFSTELGYSTLVSIPFIFLEKLYNVCDYIKKIITEEKKLLQYPSDYTEDIIPFSDNKFNQIVIFLRKFNNNNTVSERNILDIIDEYIPKNNGFNYLFLTLKPKSLPSPYNYKNYLTYDEITKTLNKMKSSQQIMPYLYFNISYFEYNLTHKLWKWFYFTDSNEIYGVLENIMSSYKKFNLIL